MHMLSPRWLAAIFVPAAGLLVLIAIGGATGYLDFRSLMADATAVGELHPFTGAMSNLGVLLWWTAATVSLFAAAVVGRRDETGASRFLLSAGLLSVCLAVDDLFLIHETLDRGWGIPEEVVFAALGLAVGLHLFVFRRLIRHTSYGLLIVALVMLGASVAMDTIFHPWVRPLGHWEFFLEDGAKWLGIVSWCAYYTSASLQLVGAAVPASARTRAPVIEWKPAGIEGERDAARRRVRG